MSNARKHPHAAPSAAGLYTLTNIGQNDACPQIAATIEYGSNAFIFLLTIPALLRISFISQEPYLACEGAKM